MFDKLRETTADGGAVASAAREAGLDGRERRALAREMRKLIADIGGGERYAALSRFLDEIERTEPGPCSPTD